MNNFKLCALLFALFATHTFGAEALEPTATIRIATFNASLEGGNYSKEPNGQELKQVLENGEHPQVRNIAEIIQRVRPDILLINEFDYYSDPEIAIQPFLKHYLLKAQQGTPGINYPYFYSAPANTGIDSGLDLNRDGIASGSHGDAWGFGVYPGQYGMLLLSKYPIDTQAARTFQHFKWQDMPNSKLADIKAEDGNPWYPEDARAQMPLSSKSHWDVPVLVDGISVHVLASHPTPPVFDGPEKRNQARNHDEIRLWVDYLTPESGHYIYDDKGSTGGFAGERFVVLGDLNASIDNGDADKGGIGALLAHESVRGDVVPSSKGAALHSPDNPNAGSHTAAWRMRADYVLPSTKGMQVIDAGVFWPPADDALHRLVESREMSSDHRLVWVDVILE